MLLLPLDSSPAKVFTVQLGDGNKYVLETRYNEGFAGDGGFWTFDLSRAIDGVVLATGVPILLGEDLLSPYALGMGALIAVDEANTDTDAGPDDLGVRVNVYWASADELKAAAAAAASP